MRRGRKRPSQDMAQGSRRGRSRRLMAVAIFGVGALSWAALGNRPTLDRGPDSPTPTRGHQAESPAVARGLSSIPPILPSRAVDASVLDRTTATGDQIDSSHHVAYKVVAGNDVPESLESPIARALRAIEACQSRYDEVRDYICTFSKRERINGRLIAPHVMLMKARTQPRSVYLKFRQPAAGREAIYIEGRHDGKVLAHDVGLGRLIAGTLHLDPTGARAMVDCRHPITEAGIGPLLDTVETRWSSELDSFESKVDFREVRLETGRPCTRIDVTHTRQSPEFLFYRVCLYIDRELGLPIRFEAYDWPADARVEPLLLEEYSYSDLRLNVGLGDIDFDVKNSEYAFGRF